MYEIGEQVHGSLLRVVVICVGNTTDNAYEQD